MAIQHNIEKFGVTFENVYTRIGESSYANAFKEYLTYGEADYSNPDDPQPTPPISNYVKTRRYSFTAHTYINEESFLNRADEIMSKNYGFFLTGSVSSSANLLELGYNYLKTLPEFSGSIDV
jgi:hypothetical protein